MFVISSQLQDKAYTGLNNMSIIFLFIIFHFSKHLQFKFDLSINNPFKENKLTKYRKPS